MPIGDITPVLSLTVGAALLLVICLFLGHRQQWLCGVLALAVLGTAAYFTVSLHLFAQPTLSFSGTWALDDLTAWASYSIIATAALTILLSPRWFATDSRHGEWYVLLLFGTLGAILMAGAADLMELMVAMLLSSVSGYTMAGFHRASRMCAEAGAKYYFLGALASPLMFVGIVLLYGLAGDTAYHEVGTQLAAEAADPVVAAAAMGCILLGLTFKLGAVPGHPWVPDVAQGSPAPAAAFLTVAPKIGALVALVRIVSLLPEDLLAWRWTIALVAAATMTLGNLAALWQEDLRRLLGWSSVSQAGYGLMAAVAVGMSQMAGPALVLFLLAYAFANVAAFAAVASLRGRTGLADYDGLARSRPWHAALLTVALLSLVGIPPLAGFAAKFALFAAAIEAGFAWLALVAVINTVISIFYYLRVVGTMYLGRNVPSAATLGASAAAAMFVSGVLTVLMGLGAHLVFSDDLRSVTALLW